MENKRPYWGLRIKISGKAIKKQFAKIRGNGYEFGKIYTERTGSHR